MYTLILIKFIVSLHCLFNMSSGRHKSFSRTSRASHDAKKLALALQHNERNELAHCKAEENKSKKKGIKLEFDSFYNIKDLENETPTTQQEIIIQMNTEQNYFRRVLEDIKYYRAFNTKEAIYNLQKKIKKTIKSQDDIYTRSGYTQIVYGGLKVTVVPDSYSVCVYIVVPVTHKNFETCTNKFQNYTYDKVLVDGSKKFGWNFGGPQKMLMYNIDNLMMQHYFNPSNDPFDLCNLINKISSLEIITLKKVETLIINQISYL